jgi:hypothetical protein
MFLTVAMPFGRELLHRAGPYEVGPARTHTEWSHLRILKGESENGQPPLSRW